MRIAVLFSGRVAGYSSNYESLFKGLLKGQEVYFFLSHSPELQEDLEGFKLLFNPKILNNDEIVYPDVSNYPKKEDGKTNKHNTMCMFFNRKRVFEDLKKYMEETGEQYDLYISCRVDSYNISKINYDLFQDCTDKDIYIPYSGDGINDRFAIGNFKAMETYMSLYDEIIDMLNEGTIIHPETLLLTYLNRKSMNIQRFPYLYKIFD